MKKPTMIHLHILDLDSPGKGMGWVVVFPAWTTTTDTRVFFSTKRLNGSLSLLVASLASCVCMCV